ANLNHSLNGPKISPDDGLTPRQRNLLTLQQTRGTAAVLRMLKTTETVQRQNEQAQVNSVEVTPPGSLRFSGSLGPLTADVDTEYRQGSYQMHYDPEEDAFIVMGAADEAHFDVNISQPSAQQRRMYTAYRAALTDVDVNLTINPPSSAGQQLDQTLG